MDAPPPPPAGDPSVGLCARCAEARTQRSARGSVFWRCAGADADPALPRYPRLPVRACPAFTPGSPDAIG